MRSLIEKRYAYSCSAGISASMRIVAERCMLPLYPAILFFSVKTWEVLLPRYRIRRMSSENIFITREIPLAGPDLLQGEIATQIWPHAEPPSYEELSEIVRGRDGLLCLLTDQIDAALMERSGSQLKVISQMAVGVDNIDLKAATARGIPIGHTPGVLADSTADFAWTLLLAAARRLVEADRYVRAGKWKSWSPTALLGADIYAATLGIVGLGRIGAAVARREAGFDMRILYSNGEDAALNLKIRSV